MVMVVIVEKLEEKNEKKNGTIPHFIASFYNFSLCVRACVCF